MPATIEVEAISSGEYNVVVKESGGETRHRVRVDPGYAQKLTGGTASTTASTLELLRRSFEFLLEREPKESILGSFDLPLIGRYFAEYERVIADSFSSR
ncbi:MAG: hypothetical protein O2968_00800 [Acidobacteria bacterium]|nr:hypothetical protein [Acidobacteriota bacterium]